MSLQKISKKSACISNDGDTTLSKIVKLVLTERFYGLLVLIIVMVCVFTILGNTGFLFAKFDIPYLASSLQSLVPLALLALAEMFVIISGRSGIDLSVGAMVSTAGMVFGYLIQAMHFPLLVAMVLTLIVGLLMGLVNGILVGVVKFPPLIATLATSYIFMSGTMVVSNQAPISGELIAKLNEDISGSFEIFSGVKLPMQVITFLLPAILICWFMLNKATWGRKLIAIGTNDEAARYAAQNVAYMRCSAYVFSGFLCSLAAIINVAQFASARPDAGTAGAGMTLPAITIAALGGVLIQGGYGRVSGVVAGALLITWLNAALLISFSGSAGPRTQLLALGIVLIVSILVNSYAARKYRMKV